MFKTVYFGPKLIDFFKNMFSAHILQKYIIGKIKLCTKFLNRNAAAIVFCFKDLCCVHTIRILRLSLSR